MSHCHEFAVDDDGKLYQKFTNKRVNAASEDISFELSWEEYVELVEEANLVSSQLGYTGDNYVLARYGDTGSYSYGNCRFITQKENNLEKKITPSMRAASLRNVRKMIESNRLDPEIGRKISRGIRNSKSYKDRVIRSEERKRIREENLNPSYKGKNNSQYGTFWITNGIDNMKWKDEKGRNTRRIL